MFLEGGQMTEKETNVLNRVPKYPVDEVLQGDTKPCFCAADKNGKTHRVYLDVV